MADDIPKRQAKKIISAYSKGVVPREGMGYVAVGRDNEIRSIVQDMENTAEGDGSFRFIIGDYGSGKSFMTQLIRHYALLNGFVVMDGDFAINRRLIGTKKEGLNMYRELIKNMSIKSKPDGGAVETLLKRWIEGIKKDIAKERGLDVDSISDYAVTDRIRILMESMSSIRYYSDFVNIVISYWESYKRGTGENHALRWIKGEYEQKTLAKKDLGIGMIIDDQNWYEFIKVWAKFSTTAGYKGLIVILDEGINLFKLTSSKARENNYECMLSMYNDISQGKAENLTIYVCETHRSLEDRNRGLYSYDAIRTRIEPKHSNLGGYINQMGPLMILKPLTRNEMATLLVTLRDIHAQVNNYDSPVTVEDITNYLGPIYSSLGAEQMLTPRQVTKDFIEILNIMIQNSPITFMEIVRGYHHEEEECEDDKFYNGLDL